MKTSISKCLKRFSDFKGIHPIAHPLGTTATLKEVSNGKDTMTGHWEMMGLKVTKPFKTFKPSFASQI